MNSVINLHYTTYCEIHTSIKVKLKQELICHKKMTTLFLDLIFVFILIITFVDILLTIVCLFWCIFLIDAIKRKYACYRSNLRCQQGEDDFHNQSLAYIAKTELVKYGFLFCIHIVEWLGFTFATIFTLVNTANYYHYQNLANHTNSTHKSLPLVDLPFLNNVFLELSMVLVGCLCMYLAERQAQISWIKSNSIPHWICFFLLCSILTQTLVTVRYTRIIGIWLDILLITLSLIFALRQYRRLNMVIKWSIVDLQVRGSKRLLAKQIRMKRNFNKGFTLIRIGVICILISEILMGLFVTVKRITHKEHAGNLSIFQNSDISHIYILQALSLTLASLSAIGYFIVFFPYIAYGFVTMFVILWRLFKGKTGYRTHFHNQLTDPLV